MGYEKDLTGKATLAAEDIRFARTIDRIQRITLSELYKIALVHLYSQGYTGEELTNFELDLTTDRLIDLFKKCLPDHYLNGRNCYSIKNDIQVLSYDLAQASCNSMEVIGSQPSLVSISTKDELDFVNSLIKTNLNSPASVLVSINFV